MSVYGQSDGVAGVVDIKRRMMPMGKKRLRDMTWDDYGISKNRYKELKAFCLQYDEKKSRIRYGILSVQNDGIPGGNFKESPVEKQAIENSVFLKDVRMIEEAAIKADPAVWRYVLKSVVSGLPYECIEYDDELGKIPMCRSDFYGTRKRFFSILNNLQLEQKLTVKT